ncbi:MAG: M23 family metallopeptidase [Actinomycetota bacterium]|nr:M23 family metallopeptidase [Actinomycetota bacterium]
MGCAAPAGGHEGADLMTPSGVPEYAITDGTVVPVSGSNEKGWNNLGGYAVMIRADHDIGPVKEGDLFYYADMNGRSPLPIGSKVQAGQVVGYSEDTGQGPEGTRGLFPPHLHLGWYDGSGGRSEKADRESEPRKQQCHRPEKPEPGEGGGCETAGCSVEPDDPQTTGEPPEDTIPSASRTTVFTDEEKESDPQLTAEPMAGEDGASGEETDAVP